MADNRGRRRRGGITVTDQRRDGLGISSASPIDFGEIAGEARDAVFTLLSAITDTGSGRLATKARNAVATIMLQVEGV